MPTVYLQRSSHHRFRWFFLAIALAVVFAPPVAAQLVLRVDPNAPAGGDGLSWSTAYRGLHEALAQAAQLAQPESTIWLKAGIYRTDGPGATATNRAAAFELVNGVTILGGFSGTESDASQRDPAINHTVLSGEIGDPALTSDNSYHVLRFIAPTGPVVNSATLNGLTIEMGNANASSGDDSTGGALVTRFTNVTIRNCLLRNNTARQGAGVFSRNGTLTIESTRFSTNAASADGGAIYSQSDLVVRDCEFNANNATFGGAVLACCRPVELRDCVFDGNFASWGGAIYHPSGTPVLARIEAFGNSASRGGFLYAGTAVVACNLRLGSNIANNGGAIYSTVDLSLSNVAMVRNNAFENGGGIHIASGGLSIQHLTAYDNNALIFGGLTYAAFGSIEIANSIVSGNSDNAGDDDTSQLYNSGLATYIVETSILTGLTGGVPTLNVLDTAPLFVDPEGPDGVLGTEDDDLSLGSGSPAIDAADPALVPPDSADIDLDADTSEPLPLDIRALVRTFGLAPDMGAYEDVPDISSCPGDVNGDGVVNLSDFNIIGINFGSGPGATRQQGDLNSDGFVDISDFNILGVTFGTNCSDE